MKKRRYKKSSDPSLSFPRWIMVGTLLSASVMVASFGVYLGPSIIDKTTASAQMVSSRISSWKSEIQRNREIADAAKAEDTTPSIYSLQTTIPHLAAAQEEAGNQWDITYESPEEDLVYTAMLDTSLGPMLYYNQGDSRWAEYLYGGQDPMKQYGCGPTAVAMIVNSFSSVNITPVEMADWASSNGCHAPHGGSYHNLIRDSLTAYGFQVEAVRDRTPENVVRLIDSGHILVALMGEGIFTDNGHFILLTEVLDDGKIRIADPNNFDNCTKEWSLSELIPELKKVYDHGAPLWAVSLPES